MDDTISRTWLLAEYDKRHKGPPGGARKLIEEAPSAQPEIIHCGECTKMEVDSVFHDCWCGETGKKVWVNHYCGYADRREERR